MSLNAPTSSWVSRALDDVSISLIMIQHMASSIFLKSLMGFSFFAKTKKL